MCLQAVIHIGKAGKHAHFQVIQGMKGCPLGQVLGPFSAEALVLSLRILDAQLFHSFALASTQALES